MLTPTSSSRGRGRSRRRHRLWGAVTLLAALATIAGMVGLQAPAASAGVARPAAADHALAARLAAALAHSHTGRAPASKSPAAKNAASKRTHRSFASSVPKGGKAGHKVTVGHSVKNDVSAKLRNIKPKPFTKRHRKVIPVLPLTLPHATRAGPVAQAKVDSVLQSKANPVLQSKLAPSTMPGTQLNFDGQSYPGVSCFCAPPDTNGAVGATQYVQMVNEGIQVFDKTTGNSVLGPESITPTTRSRTAGSSASSRSPLQPLFRTMSASPSRPRATPRAPITGTRSTSAVRSGKTSTTTRSWACGRTGTT